MVSEHAPSLDPNERRELPASLRPRTLLVSGLVVLAVSYGLSHVLAGGPRRFCFAYLTGFAFLLSLSLGALFFVIVHHLTRSGWSVVVRRPAEVLAANVAMLPWLALPLAVLVVVGYSGLYPWVDGGGHDTAAHVSLAAPAQAAAPMHAGDTAEAGHGAEGESEHGHDALTLHKRPYLNVGFFILRWVVYFAVWAGFGSFFWRRSVAQDTSGDVALTLRMQALSGPAIVLYGFTVTFAAFDLLMSLDPHWYSTVFGVYYYSGAMVGFFALCILILMGLQRWGLLTRSVTVEHYHDLGKWLFAFVFFWGYIAFSQYMLIWYGNIPEETEWLLRRGMALQAPNAWSVVAVVLLFGHFLIPFAGLLSRHVKRSRRGLAFWAAWLLVMHWIDVYWMVMPEFTTRRLPLGPVEVGCLVGTALLFGAGLVRRGAGHSLLPLRDPRLAESLAFHNT